MPDENYIRIDDAGNISKEKELPHKTDKEKKEYGDVIADKEQADNEACKIKMVKTDPLIVENIQIDQYVISCHSDNEKSCKKCVLKVATKKKKPNGQEHWVHEKQELVKDHNFKILTPQDKRDRERIFYCTCEKS